jgi:RNA polymerase sigma-70 factor (ECF subfamily)
MFATQMNGPPQESAMELRLAATSAASHAPDGAELEAAVIHLFDQLHPRLASYVLGFGVAHHDAEDIVQETFLSLFRHLKLGRPQWNLHGWLFRVAHNLALKRRTSHQSVDIAFDAEKLLADQPDPRHNAEEHVAFLQTQQRLRAVFEVLPEQDQRCLQLRAEGLKYRDIARVLGISLGSVSASLSRSLARMARSTGGER